MSDTGGTVLKVDFINDAYSQLRINGLTVNPTPSDLELALMRLEDMAAEFHTRNIIVGYNFEDEPDPNTPSNVIRGYKQAFATNLALRLIPDFNKDPSGILILQASQSLSNMSGRVAMERLNQVQYPRRMGRGSGNTLRYNRWARFYRNVTLGTNNGATNTMFIGDINDFVEHFDAYLDSAETISSFDIVTDPSLTLVSSSNDSPDISYRIESGDLTTNQTPSGPLVTIIITTSTGRVETRQIQFVLTPREEAI